MSITDVTPGQALHLDDDTECENPEACDRTVFYPGIHRCGSMSEE